MGLLWIEQKWDDEGRDSQTRDETIVRYILEMGDDADGKKEVRSALSVRNGTVPPLSPFSPHPKNDSKQQLFVSQLYVTRQGFSKRWDVEVTYSDEVNLPEDPLKRPMEWEIDTDVKEEPSLTDIDGNPYLNTAGSWIEATNDAPHIILRGKRSIPTAWPSWLLDYAGAINADAVTIKGRSWPEKTLKVTSIKISPDLESRMGYEYCDLELELEFNRNDWTFRTPNRGFIQKINIVEGRKINGRPAPPIYKYVKIKVKNEHGVLEDPQEPQMLNKAGQYIAEPTPQNIVILKFKRNLILPFSALPLK